MSEAQCPACRAFVNGGWAGCQAVWDEVSVLAYTHPTYAAMRDLAFDTYCMQHPEHYGRSAKSYAAHLCRLCCGLEHNAAPATYAAIRQWLDGVNIAIEKPPLLSARGQLTVLSVRALPNAEAYPSLVQVWAENVWEAYREQHPLARNWIAAALVAYKKVNPKQRRQS